METRSPVHHPAARAAQSLPSLTPSACLRNPRGPRSIRSFVCSFRGRGLIHCSIGSLPTTGRTDSSAVCLSVRPPIHPSTLAPLYALHLIVYPHPPNPTCLGQGRRHRANHGQCAPLAPRRTGGEGREEEEEEERNKKKAPPNSTSPEKQKTEQQR
ncbi:hypothetical protein BKA80DRAFT_12034 [Phyllosticta citrichinensis]